MIAKLGQCLGRSNADAGGYANPLQDTLSDLAAEFGEVFDAIHTGETFVY